MGVRFACHACGKRLNIKSELAGRRGICPSCSVRFRIPDHDTETSTPIETGDTNGSSDSVITSDGAEIASSAKASSLGGTATRSIAAAQSTATRQADDHQQPVQQTVQRPSQAIPQPSGTTTTQTLEEILGGSSATWYVRPPSGGQYGPADGPTLGQWITEGRVADTAMLWRDGWPDWRGAKQVLPIFSSKGASAIPPSQPATNVPVVGADVGGGIVAASRDSAAPAESSSDLRTGGKVLDTNKKKVSRKRVAVSAVLACVFLVLLIALIFVLRQP